jgi:two-component system response regulator YesN
MADTPSILAWFFQVVEKLAKAISEQHSKTDSNMMVLAKKKISDHLYDPELSLSLISSQLDITPAYFSAFFIREVGVGFNEYVTGLRIEKAKQLLSETNLKINSIAMQCGFRSASYFIVVFRKQTGSSPSEYRNTKNQNK